MNTSHLIFCHYTPKAPKKNLFVTRECCNKTIFLTSSIPKVTLPYNYEDPKDSNNYDTLQQSIKTILLT